MNKWSDDVVDILHPVSDEFSTLDSDIHCQDDSCNTGISGLQDLVKCLSNIRDELDYAIDRLNTETFDNDGLYVSSDEDDVKDLDESMLTEDEDDIESIPVSLDANERNNPKEFSLKSTVSRRMSQARAAKAEQDAKNARQSIKAKYSASYTELKGFVKDATIDDSLQKAFELFVPNSGHADTVAGEMIRAMNRIGYRYLNDGDVFFCGYGLETCASSVSYLIDICDKYNFSSNYAQKFKDCIEDEYAYDEDRYGEKYYESLILVLNSLLDELIEDHEDLFYTPNTDDSREWDYESIKDEQPLYSELFYTSYRVADFIEAGLVSERDVHDFVSDICDNEYGIRGTGADINVNGSEVEITDLTAEAYQRAQEVFGNDSIWDSFYEEYCAEHEDELNSDDEDWDEDEDEDLDEGLGCNNKSNKKDFKSNPDDESEALNEVDEKKSKPIKKSKEKSEDAKLTESLVLNANTDYTLAHDFVPDDSADDINWNF